MAVREAVSDGFWDRVREALKAVLFDPDGSKPDAVVTDACQREAATIAAADRVDAVAHALEVEAHERGLLQRCPPLRWRE